MLKIYMGYAAPGLEYGAFLIFAHNGKEAKKYAYYQLREWFDEVEWIDARADRLWNSDFLYKQANQGMLNADIAHVIDDPECCKGCELWGFELDENGLCKGCREKKAQEAMMEDYRLKFARENLKKAQKGSLTEWEKRFVESMEKLIKANVELSQEQFNTLKEIADLSEVRA